MILFFFFLTSEFPWQCNDASTFFYMPLYFLVPGVFFRNRLGELVPPLVALISLFVCLFVFL